MKIRQRAFALVSILAIAWGSLWPLVSAAGPRPATLPNFICTQAGFQPHDFSLPQAPGDHDKFHCPLCATGADATLPVVSPAPTWVLSVDAPMPEPLTAAPHRYYDAGPPPSRAPPATS